MSAEGQIGAGFQQEVQDAQAERREHISPSRTVKEAQRFQRTMGAYHRALAGVIDSGSIQHDASISGALTEIRAASQRAEDGADQDNLRSQEVSEPSQRVYQWLRGNYGGALALLEQTIPQDQHARLQELVALQVAHLHADQAGFDGAERKSIENAQLQEMAEFLLAAPTFQHVRELQQQEGLDLNGAVWNSGDEDLARGIISNEANIDALVIAAKAKEEIAQLDPEIQRTELKRWIAEMARETRSGRSDDETSAKRKIFDTPYYTALLDRMHEMDRIRNGKGGVILYGPPGTGKTELIKEKNAQEGFDTHVINIHHFTSMGELLAERPIMEGPMAGGAPIADIETFVQRMDGRTPAEFQAVMHLIKPANVELTMGEFLLTHVDTRVEGIMDILARDEAQYTLDDWAKIKDAFRLQQERRVGQRAIGEHRDADEEKRIIEGEILLAVKRSEQSGRKVRVVLDEIDKAGPTSLGGLLTFLAESPGQDYEYNGVRVPIPEWFRVDATSNKNELNDYLVDRFRGVWVDTPPPKDQLMIAAVRLSDLDGNIQLKPYEQEQLAGFFMYAVPRINEVLQNTIKDPQKDPPEAYPPLSNRWIQELTSNLVDFTTKSRNTLVSVSDAIRSALLEDRMWAKNTGLVTRLEGMLDGAFGYITYDEQQPVRRLPNRRRAGRGEVPDQQQESEETRSPLIDVIVGLQDKAVAKRGINTKEQIILDDADQAQLVEAMQPLPERPGDRLFRLRLANGLEVGILPRRPEDNESPVSMFIQSGSHNLFAARLSSDYKDFQQISGASADGERVVITTGKGEFLIVSPLDSKVLRLPEDIGREKELSVADSGELVGHLHEDGTLRLYDTSNIDSVKAKRVLKGIDTFQFAPDGRSVLVKKKTGEVELLDARTLRPVLPQPLSEIADEGTTGWQFTGKHLLVQKTANGVGEEAIYVA